MTDLKNRVAARANNGNHGNGAPGKQLDPVDRKVADARAMFQSMKGEFAVALPKHVGVDRFMRMALTCVRKTPALLDCDPPTVIAALMEAARLGLEPGTKQAAIVPFGKTATFIAQWQGLVELMYRSGQVGSVTAEFIHERDDWEYSIGDGGRFWHRPNLLASDRGAILLAYAFATLKDGSRSKVVFLTRQDAEEVRDKFSKNYQRAEDRRSREPDQFNRNPTWGKFNSTWHTDFDAMWRKSCVRRLADWVPSSPELRELLMKENEAGEMREAAEQIVPDAVFDAEVVEDEGAHVGGGAPGGGDMAARPAASDWDPDSHTDPEPTPVPGPASETGEAVTDAQLKKLHAVLTSIGWTDRDDRLRAAATIVGRPLDTSKAMTTAEASTLIETLEQVATHHDPAERLTDLLAEIRAHKGGPS